MKHSKIIWSTSEKCGRTMLTATSSLFLALSSFQAMNAADKPNVLVILLDDCGFSDLGCFGGEIPTPNIDALAQRGVRFNQMYNCARSCPSRSALLTGLYPQEAGVGWMSSNDYQALGGDAYQGYLNDKCITFAQMGQTAGYYTGFSGKWHVGGKTTTKPATRGFQRSLSAAAGGFYFPTGTGVNLEIDNVAIQPTDSRLPANWYSTDMWTEFTLKFIDESIVAKKPFMCYLAHNAPHFPVQAPQSEILSWRGKFKEKGWDQMRKERYQKQIAMNLFGKPYPLTPRSPLIPKWEDLTDAQKDQADYIYAIYAAVIQHIDKSIGQLIDGLRTRGVLDNTFIILVSDNGGNAEGGTFGTFKGSVPGDPASTVWIGQAMGEVCNTPFFLYKHHTHEGGISAPCIVSYPNGMPASRYGTIAHEPAHLIDIMPTINKLIGATYPATFGGKTITPLEGIDIMPAVLGGTLNRTQPIYWEHESNYALRDGKWKLVKERMEKNWQLYDMERNRTETEDVSSCYPEIKNEMMIKLQNFKKKVGSTDMAFPDNAWLCPVIKY